ncbi:MAG TPA: STAS domain-containing protein [Steroidobacteraceae bacterium]|nr:STAS domain-containing protein [Steroidobacteraceae bacterium]
MSLAEATRTSGSIDAAAFRLSAGAAGTLSAEGPLSFATARDACALGIAALTAAGGRTLEIDCRGITRSDSAGLAVLLEWLAAARRCGKSLHYTHLPEGLAALARISEVQELLERGV